MERLKRKGKSRAIFYRRTCTHCYSPFLTPFRKSISCYNCTPNNIKEKFREQLRIKTDRFIDEEAKI